MKHPPAGLCGGYCNPVVTYLLATAEKRRNLALVM